MEGKGVSGGGAARRRVIGDASEICAGVQPIYIYVYIYIIYTLYIYIIYTLYIITRHHNTTYALYDVMIFILTGRFFLRQVGTYIRIRIIFEKNPRTRRVRR